jgi:hypothetical protein
METRLLKTLCESLAKRLLQQHTPAHHKNRILRQHHDKEAIMSAT